MSKIPENRGEAYIPSSNTAPKNIKTTTKAVTIEHNAICFAFVFIVFTCLFPYYTLCVKEPKWSKNLANEMWYGIII